MNGFNIDRFLQMKLKNRIDRVGIELEGGWEKLPKFEHGEEFGRDGSVNIPTMYEEPEPVAPVIPGLTTPIPEFNLQEALENYNRDQPDYRRLFPRGGNYRSNLSEQMFVDFRGGSIGMGSGQAFIDTLRDQWNTAHGGGPFVTPRAPKRREKKIHVGEVPGPILEVSKVADWLRKCYPQHVNHTCGMHVHMSFRKALHYSRLMVPEYQATVINYLSKWAMTEKLPKKHPIWDRLSGNNQYCKLDYFADVQASKTSKSYDHQIQGSRYTAINYCHGQHGTIECRILPMFEDVEVAIKAVHEVVNITNACLKVGAKKEEVVCASVIEDSINGVDRQNRREVV